MGNERLLIIDDDLPTREMMRDIAATLGVPARHTSDPAIFLKAASEWKPTHIVVDLKMPEMDGMQVMNKLARQKSSAAIIISSGACDRVLDAAARSANESGLNVAGVLPKPFRPNDLRRLFKSQPDGKPPETRQEMFAIHSVDVKQAFERRELQAFYQPKIRCDTGRLVGFEALVRWRHPKHGLITPDRFLPVVEANGMIGELTRFMLDRSLSFLSRLTVCEFSQASSDAQRLTMAVNITPAVLEQPDFVDQALEACLSHGINADQLILELTESSGMESIVASLATLTRLGIKGFCLSIDDFGTGYSSMRRLVQLPFTEIKIDKSFVLLALASKDSRSVIRSIVGLGKGLGLHTVAEGVEEPRAFEFLSAVGCDTAQGYLISRPVPEVDLLKWIRTECISGSSITWRAMMS